MENLISNVQVYLFKNPTGKAVAWANVTIANSFVIKKIKIINGANGYFLSMPSTKNKNNEFEDLFFPINREARSELQNAIMEKFNELKNTEENKPKPTNKSAEKVFNDKEEDFDLPF